LFTIKKIWCINLYSPTQEQHSVYSVDKHVRQSLQQEQFCILVISQSHDLINIHLLTMLTHKASLQPSEIFKKQAASTASCMYIFMVLTRKSDDN